MSARKGPFEGLSVADARAAYLKAGWPIAHGAPEITVDLGNGLCAVVVEHEGRAHLAKLCSANSASDKLPPCPTIVSAGAAHIYLFRHKGTLPSAVNFYGVVTGAHVWGLGRSILLPPSWDGQNMNLRWVHTPTREAFASVPELPRWIDEMARDPAAGRRAWDAALAPAPETVPRTDYGNAERLVRRHGHDLRWCGAWGSWLVWDGTRWAKDESGEVTRRAKDTVRMIGEEASKVSHEETRRALLGWALASENNARIGAMVALARSERGIPVGTEDLDADPWILNCRNGILDLRTGQLGPHRREVYCTKLVPVDYTPTAECPAFDAFLATVQPDPEVRAFLLRLLGYALIGVVLEHVLPIHYGAGANGKSTLTGALLQVLGDYAAQVPTSILLAKDREAHPTELTTLRGVRFAACEEVNQGRALDAAQVKGLTGGEPIPARYMRGDYFTFIPTHTLWVSLNHKPRVTDTSNAMWRRVLLILWGVVIPNEQQDTALKSKLAAEAPGILRRLVDGCAEYLRRGLAPPEAVRIATEAYRVDSDIFADFLEARCTAAPMPSGSAPRVTSKELWMAYQDWCKDSGSEPKSQTALGRYLGEKGCTKDKSGTVSWRGIRLRVGSDPPWSGRLDSSGQFPTSLSREDLHHSGTGELSETIQPSNGASEVWTPEIVEPPPEVLF